MASENKKKKQKNSHAVPSILKNKLKGIKGLDFYTSSERQNNKISQFKLRQLVNSLK